VPQAQHWLRILKQQLQGLLIELPDRRMPEMVGLAYIMKGSAQLFLACMSPHVCSVHLIARLGPVHTGMTGCSSVMSASARSTW